MALYLKDNKKMFIQNRDESRAYFYNVWKKQKNKLPLEPEEVVISDVISEHPEYHYYLDSKESVNVNDFNVENNEINPFLHMGMHIALKEQVNSDRPIGINTIFKQIISRSITLHDAEHKMMECLGRSLWEAQCKNQLPDENEYMECLKRIS